MESLQVGKMWKENFYKDRGESVSIVRLLYLQRSDWDEGKEKGRQKKKEEEEEIQNNNKTKWNKFNNYEMKVFL